MQKNINRVEEAVSFSPVQQVKATIERTSRIANVVSMVTIVAMMILTVVDIALRKFGGSVMGTVEISEFMLVVIAFFSFSYCWVLDGHIQIDVITRHLPPKAKSASTAFGALIGLGFFGSMLLGSVGITIEAYEKAETSIIHRIPLFPLKGLIMIGCLIFCLQLIVSFVNSFLQIVKGR